LLAFLSITAAVVSYYGLYVFFAAKYYPLSEFACILSPHFNCLKAALSKFTRIFGLPIVFIFALIYTFNIVISVLSFFSGEDKKVNFHLIAQFMIFISLVLSVFVFITLLIFAKNAGVIYAALFIINLSLSLYLYFSGKDFLKQNIFDKEGFEKYKKLSAFKNAKLVSAVIFVLALGINIPSYFVMKEKITSYYSVRQESARDGVQNQMVENFKLLAPVEIDLSEVPMDVKGNSKIVMVKFTDFRCFYCRKFYKVVDKYIKANPGDITLYVIPYTFSPQKCRGEGGENPSCLSIYAAYIAYKKNVFSKYYNTLFKSGDTSKRHVLRSLSLATGKSYSESAVLNNRDAAKWAEKMLTLAEKLNVSGTPTAYINGRQIESGYAPYKFFIRYIAEAKKHF
jgi:protein-disulfide isomerase/uncharacterized membrane protein